MNWDVIQTILLVVLVDRQLILRKRYMIAIEHTLPKYSNYFKAWSEGYFAVWIVCKKGQDEKYSRDGGKRLFYFHYNKLGKRSKT